MYKPLPDFLRIDDSEIHGQGLFATEDIEKNLHLGISHYFLAKKIIRTPLGGFINHSDNPNCYCDSGYGFRELYTLREIKKGEELTVYYELYEV